MQTRPTIIDAAASLADSGALHRELRVEVSNHPNGSAAIDGL
jgi:hypothetical protein